MHCLKTKHLNMSQYAKACNEMKLADAQAKKITEIEWSQYAKACNEMK